VAVEEPAFQTDQEGRCEEVSIHAFDQYAKKCPICGKEFIAREDWTFRTGEGRFICSWKCQRAWDMSHNRPDGKRHFVRKARVD